MMPKEMQEAIEREEQLRRSMSRAEYRRLCKIRDKGEPWKDANERAGRPRHLRYKRPESNDVVRVANYHEEEG